MLGSPAAPTATGGGPAGHQRGLWPLAPAPALPAAHLTTTAAEGYSRYGVYSLFPGAGSPAPGMGVGAALYSHTSAIGRFATAQAATPGQAAATAFHATHKMTDSLFSSSNYTAFGAPTPPPGSPYSPVPVSQLELLAKGISTSIAAAITQAANVPTPAKLHPKPASDELCKDRCWAAVKAEKNSSGCGCQMKAKFSDTSSGCSRTNPVEWTAGAVHVKRENFNGGGSTPCQVAEVTTSEIVAATPRIKVEQTSPEDGSMSQAAVTGNGLMSSKHDVHISVPTSVMNGNIPVGIAVARQRLQQDYSSSPNLASSGLMTPGAAAHQLKEISRITEMDAGMAAAAVGGAGGGASGTLLQCGDERATGLAAWPMGGTAPTLWQYPAPMPIEPMLPLPIPMPPMGFQLVRDPSSGHFLLIPTATLEQLQQAVVWPTYSQPSSHVLLPPLPPPPPLAPLQLLSSATSSDYLATSTTLHQHTQTHSTRLVALASNGPHSHNDGMKSQHRAAISSKAAGTALSVPVTHTLIKIEADCTAMATATIDPTKAMYSEPMQHTSPPPPPPTGSLVATHVFYQHPAAAANLILSQAPPQANTATIMDSLMPCKSQATSPVTCLTPPPENLAVQDAGIQTDSHLILDEQFEPEPQIDLNTSKHPDSTYLPPPVDTARVTPSPEPEMKSTPIAEIAPIEMKPLPSKPDISGLELLSNSIVEFENSRQSNSVDTTPVKYEPREETATPVTAVAENGDEVLHGIAHMTLKDREVETTVPVTPGVDDALGGLGLLCALAEQRFMEEVGERQNDERRRDKRKSRHSSSVEPKIKRNRYIESLPEEEVIRENERALERERLSVLRRVTGERGLTAPDSPVVTNNSTSFSPKVNGCSCKDDQWKNKSRDFDENNDETQNKYTINNNNNNNNNMTTNNSPANNLEQPETTKARDWSPEFMSAVERDMRQQLADLQRQYKEKQLELSKLTPKKLPTETIDITQPLNKIINRLPSPSPSPPLLDKMDSPEPERTVKTVPDLLLKPPMLSAIIPSNEDTATTKLSPHHDSYKRKLSLINHDSSDSTTPEKISSSKKRKVGRPKKLMTASGFRGATTETIVAKKPRVKAGLVGYLLAAKNRLQMQNKSAIGYPERSPPRYLEDATSSPTSSPVKTKTKPHKNSRNGLVNITNANLNLTENKNSDHRSKIRPKLKAEPTIKSSDDDDDETGTQDDVSNNDEIQNLVDLEDPEDSIQLPEPETEDDEQLPAPASPELPDAAAEDPEAAATSVEDSRCILTDAHLAVDRLRVLTAMGGLFYAGLLTAVRAPDVYAITLDGERGNRPHIMSREEILRDAIIEVSPTSTSELLPGTRLCAYWSQQYRCLYPGTVAEPGTPDPHLDLKFVSVEFDDGDSGKIALEDIRLLPAHYPIIEYDPNPLLSLSKRRRRTSVNSVTEERRLTNPRCHSATLAPSTPMEPVKAAVPLAEKENTDMNRQDSHRERKRLKKRRKEKMKKLLCHEDKKKKRKHKCCDEHCKHRKHHKKHRKHKKHHHNRNENDATVEIVNEQPVLVEQQYEVLKNENSADDDEEEENIVPQKIETKSKKTKKREERRESVESRSKMAAFLPARQLWGWSGRGYKRVGAKGRARKHFFKAIQRGKESIMVGDCAVFLSTGRPDRPYIGKIEAMWESWGTNMVVKVKWFYHPEETVGCPLNLKYPGALFESPHVDENDVQTISHKCEVLPLQEYTDKLGPEPQRYETIYDNNDIYYQAGYYDPTTTTLTMEQGIPFTD